MAALAAMTVGIAPCLPGFLAAAGVIEASFIAPIWTTLYGYAWFVSFGAALTVYYVLTYAVSRDA